jgi:hypothetical protein
VNLAMPSVLVGLVSVARLFGGLPADRAELCEEGIVRGTGLLWSISQSTSVSFVSEKFARVQNSAK